MHILRNTAHNNKELGFIATVVLISIFVKSYKELKSSW